MGRAAEPGEGEFDQLITVDGITHRPADLGVVKRLNRVIEAEPDGPPVQEAEGGLVAMGNHLGILALDKFHVRRRHGEGHVNLIGYHHLSHGDFVHTGQEDEALNPGQILETRFGRPPIGPQIPDFLLYGSSYQFVRPRDQRPPFVWVVVAKGCRILVLPDMFSDHRYPKVGPEGQKVPHKSGGRKVKDELDCQVIDDLNIFNMPLYYAAIVEGGVYLEHVQAKSNITGIKSLAIAPFCPLADIDDYLGKVVVIFKARRQPGVEGVANHVVVEEPLGAGLIKAAAGDAGDIGIKQLDIGEAAGVFPTQPGHNQGSVARHICEPGHFSRRPRFYRDFNDLFDDNFFFDNLCRCTSGQ